MLSDLVARSSYVRTYAPVSHAANHDNHELKSNAWVIEYGAPLCGPYLRAAELRYYFLVVSNILIF